VELGPDQVTAAARAELLPKIGNALEQPVADGDGNTSTESGPDNRADGPEAERQPTRLAHPKSQPNAVLFEAEIVPSTAGGNSSHSENPKT
jgi:hypothetical protein